MIKVYRVFVRVSRTGKLFEGLLRSVSMDVCRYYCVVFIYCFDHNLDNMSVVQPVTV